MTAWLSPIETTDDERGRLLLGLRERRRSFIQNLANLKGPTVSVSNYETAEPRPRFVPEFINDYIPVKGTPLPDATLLGCSCPRDLCPLPGCFCMEHSKAVNKVAYDEHDLLKEDHLYDHDAIYECGDYCACAGSCQTRVATLGRPVPLEVIRVNERGWGVRAVEDMRAGTFVAAYNGELMTNAVAEERGQILDSDDAATYLFDLDKFEIEDNPYSQGEALDTEAVEYTVDASHKGDVSRFFNHSCEPNLIIKAVVQASQTQVYRNAFFTVRNVDAGEELCFDYDPDWHAKGRRKVNRACKCGTPSCRRYIFRL
ncbi:hypothetical protein PYCC9005_005883 [Savitreella phatthalungensis]